MPKNKWFIRLILGIGCVIGLVLLRGFEDDIFYDPLKLFFKSYNYKESPLPELHSFWLFCSYSLRFLCNTVLSLVMIYLFFLDIKLIKFSILLYFLSFVLFVGLFFFFLKTELVGHQTLFYLRRFIIHPILVLLFVPGFYYQKSINFDR
jgi:exosortase F-associated protein